ncbi:DoxX family protein [Paenibacillus sp. XY044]|uniref:DoxX family protein n=1 Tax=Paenibacillus sp. XY044 TaxID=2026089 RepID=UPI000B983CDD|nr:DoxX family protein [Paenibacillus sp. XY044]OZB91296.1 hypothetical protein CJP46_28825 [Paenibacillus sp. XY044]
MKKWIPVIGWIVVAATSLFFIQSGFQKLAGTEEMADMFQELGFPDWSRYAVGLLEMAGAVLLVFPRWTHYAAGLLAVLMVGAVSSEIMAGQGLGALLPAQWLILLALIAGIRIRRILRSKPKQVAANSE